jgi:hypothetical protein
MRTQYEAFSENTTGLDFEILSVANAETIIDTAFGGMMLDLADKAWLVVIVEDSMGIEVDGATITPEPMPAGGGALLCDGMFSGTSKYPTICFLTFTPAAMTRVLCGKRGFCSPFC